MATVFGMATLLAVIAIAVASNQAAALREARQRYERALAELKSSVPKLVPKVVAAPRAEEPALLDRPTAAIANGGLTRLAELAELKDKGLVSPEEFETEKQKLLTS